MKTLEINKEKREKKQKKKKVEDGSTGELIITDNPTNNFSYLEQFTLDSFLKQTVKVTGQNSDERECKPEKESNSPKEGECEAGESDSLSNIINRIIQLCDSN